MNLNLNSVNELINRKIFAIVVSTLFLAGCGGGGGGGGSSSNVVTPTATTPDPIVTVDGGITKGPVDGASVSVFAVDSSGQKTGTAIATTTTDANGQYTVQLGNFSGVYLVEATGGSYVDEATGQTKSIPADSPLRAVSSVDSPTADVTITAIITPLTEIAVQVAEQKSGGLTVDNVTASNDEVGALFFGETSSAGDKLLTTLPADVTNEDSATNTDDERLYGLMLGAITVLQTELGSLAEVTKAIADDIAADGNLGDVSDDLVAASDKFITGDTNNSGVISSTSITNILTAAASGVGTTVTLSDETDITAFILTDSLIVSIDFIEHNVEVTVPFGTDLATLDSPTIGTSIGSSIALDGSEDFSAAVTYIVTAEDGVTIEDWLVTVTAATSDLSPLADITASNNDLITSVIINRSLHTVVGSVASLADLATLDGIDDLSLLFSVSTGANLVQIAGSYVAGTVLYAVTAEDDSAATQWDVLLRVNDPQLQPALDLADGNLSLLVSDESVQLSATGGLDELPVTFSSSDAAVVSVNAETGLLVVQGVGTATITASKSGITTSLAVFLPVEATISVTVSKLNQATLAFSQASVSVPLNGAVSNTINGGSGTGAVTYTSSNEAVATVSSNGAVTLLATGTTTISAVKAGDSTFLVSNTASYNLTVSATAVSNCVLDQSNWDACNWQ